MAAGQGQSGLVPDAQRKSFDEFAASGGAEVLARFTEVESGWRAIYGGRHAGVA